MSDSSRFDPEKDKVDLAIGEARIEKLERERNYFAELYEQATGHSGEVEARTQPCPDCDGSGANPNSYATPPCSSCDGSGEARPGPWLALRKDTDPEFMDDVVVWKPESAHMEMMDNDSLWANFSLPNSEDLTFNVFAKKRGVLEFRLIEGPTNWRDADEARKWGEGPLGGTISRGGSESADRAEWDCYYSPGNEPKREARTHTCHTDCPCQTGGVPRPDFVEVGIHPETGQSIPGIVAHIMPESEQRQEARREERTRIVALIEAKRINNPHPDLPMEHGWNRAIDDCLAAIQEANDGE